MWTFTGLIMEITAVTEQETLSGMPRTFHDSPPGAAYLPACGYRDTWPPDVMDMHGAGQGPRWSCFGEC